MFLWHFSGHRKVLDLEYSAKRQQVWGLVVKYPVIDGKVFLFVSSFKSCTSFFHLSWKPQAFVPYVMCCSTSSTVLFSKKKKLMGFFGCTLTQKTKLNEFPVV